MLIDIESLPVFVVLLGVVVVSWYLIIEPS